MFPISLLERSLVDRAATSAVAGIVASGRKKRDGRLTPQGPTASADVDREKGRSHDGQASPHSTDRSTTNSTAAMVSRPDKQVVARTVVEMRLDAGREVEEVPAGGDDLASASSEDESGSGRSSS